MSFLNRSSEVERCFAIVDCVRTSAFRLAYLYLTVASSEGHSQGHGHFVCEYLANGDR